MHMSEELEKQINQVYKPLANKYKDQEGSLNKEVKEDEAFESVLAFAHEQETRLKKQVDIIELQREKQRIMDETKMRLRQLEVDEVIEWSDTSRAVLQTENGLMYLAGDGTYESITQGALLTGGAWGMQYAPDSSVDRLTLKKYILQEAKDKLSDLWDQQIIIHEGESKKNHELLRDAYKRSEVDRALPTQEQHFGIAAEEIVLTYITRCIIDHDLPFTIKKGNAYQDITDKIDFIIHRKSEHVREVGVEAVKDRGVQFTVSKRDDLEKRKMSQLEKARERDQEVGRKIDRRLVKVSIGYVQDLLQPWQESKHPNGPSEFIEPEVTQRLFRELLEEMFSEEEIKEMWERVAGK